MALKRVKHIGPDDVGDRAATVDRGHVDQPLSRPDLDLRAGETRDRISAVEISHATDRLLTRPHRRGAPCRRPSAAAEHGPSLAGQHLHRVLQRTDRGQAASRIDEAADRLDLGAHRAGRQRRAPAARRPSVPSGSRCVGRAPAVVHAVDVGEEQERVGAELAWRAARRRGPCRSRLRRRGGPPCGRRTTGMPPPPAQIDGDAVRRRAAGWSASSTIALGLRGRRRPGASGRRPGRWSSRASSASRIRVVHVVDGADGLGRVGEGGVVRRRRRPG